MLNFKLFLETDKPHRFSCVMAVIDNPEKILDFNKQIAEKDVYQEEGREDKPHITVLYGLHTTNPNDIKKIIKDFGTIKATLGKISKFDNKPEYDVLKIDVKSPELHALNKALKKLPFTSDYPKYEPHATLAYVKKGHCQDLIDDDTFVDHKVHFKSLIFSTPDKEKFKLSLA